MIETFAKALGALLLVTGILGFIPALTPDHMLFGIFMTDTFHNVVHLLSGVVLLAVSLSDNDRAIRSTVLTFGLLYGAVTIAGFMMRTPGELFGMMAINSADNILHLVISLAAIGVALVARRSYRTTIVD